jgi:hypothetical protein
MHGMATLHQRAVAGYWLCDRASRVAGCAPRMQRAQAASSRPRPHLPSQRYVGMDQRAPPPLPRGPGFEYRYLTEFQSHEPEFDYLKSLEIEEKINKVRWVRSSSGSSKHIISTNDKTIKLWKVYEKRVTNVSGFNVDRSRWVRAGVEP